MSQLRFSLKSLFIATTIASLLCLLALIVVPPVWELAGELLAVRAFRKFVLAGLGLVAVFFGILFLAVILRYAILSILGLTEGLENQKNAERAQKEENN